MERVPDFVSAPRRMFFFRIAGFFTAALLAGPDRGGIVAATGGIPASGNRAEFCAAGLANLNLDDIAATGRILASLSAWVTIAWVTYGADPDLDDIGATALSTCATVVIAPAFI